MFIHPDHPSEPRFVGPRGLFLSSGIKQTARPECTAYALTVCREIKQGTGGGGHTRGQIFAGRSFPREVVNPAP